MAKSLREAMEAALKLQKPLPAEPGRSWSSAASAAASSADGAIQRLVKAANPKGKGGQNLIRVTYGTSTGRRANKRNAKHTRAASVVRSPPPSLQAQTATPRPATSPPRTTPPQARPPPRLQLSDAAALTLSAAGRGLLSLLPGMDAAGRSLQVSSRSRRDQREVVLGLDFGTSCAKVVFGDPVLGRSFAAAFRDGSNVESYLLPTAVFQTEEAFSLEAGAVLHRDLKLALLARSDDSELQIRAAAYLALAIRRARGWLLATHAPVYKGTEIVWRLSLGIPAAQHLHGPFVHLFRALAHAAWSVSVQAGEVTWSAVADALKAAEDPHSAADVETTVVPEIAAQIYGFVVSTSFDRHAANLYLMADVGAGTVDSSLFRVKPARRGKWDFEFYTSVVEPYGTSNLHRHRCNWWAHELLACDAPEALRLGLEDVRFQTDLGFPVPATFDTYLSGIQIAPFEKGRTPDVEFLDRVLAQVQGRTFWRAWKNNLLPQNSLTGIPLFLCGGGGRMELYQRLEAELQRIPGCSWLKADPWVMGVPTDLEAPGMDDADYDRLSVAYGLSRLDVGEVIQALPMSLLEPAQVGSWRENYVDKDMC